MRVSRTARILSAGLLGMGLALSAAAQSSQDTQIEWSSDSLNLRFLYPGDFVRRDPVEALKDGHLTVFGVPGGQVPELAEMTRCLRPLLAVELPTSGGASTETKTTNPDGSVTVTIKPALLGTILLAELAIDCMTPEQQVKARDLQTGMVDLVSKVPGMHSMMQPSIYKAGNQMMHVAAAQGLPRISEDVNATADPLLSFTMGFSTSWNNHLLVWYFSSNSAMTLNRMTKSTVRFGREKAATLYPVTIRYAGH